MKFGDILDEWEKETAKPYGKKRLDTDRRREKAESQASGNNSDSDADVSAHKAASKDLPRANPMDVWMRRYGIQDKDSLQDMTATEETPAERRRRLRSMKPEAVIDLHGLTRDEAWMRLESFFTDCRRRGMEKVLIIHGKGTHSEENPVLSQMVKLFLEQYSHAGESGHSERDAGGSGSTWVILK